MSDPQTMEDERTKGVADLRARSNGQPNLLTAQIVAEAAAEGNELARAVLADACRALGWGIAQAITLTSPAMVVIGGGVSQIRPDLFLEPVRRATAKYVFPPLVGTYQIRPAKLGEAVVVHGALAAAADRSC
jgi:glucokinase